MPIAAASMCRRVTRDEEPLLHRAAATSTTRPLAGGVAACVACIAMAGYLVLGKLHVSGVFARDRHCPVIRGSTAHHRLLTRGFRCPIPQESGADIMMQLVLLFAVKHRAPS